MKRLQMACVSVSLGLMLGVSAIAQAASPVNLKWTIPTARESGQALKVSELTGYELYYTTDNPSVSGTIKISGGSTSSYAVQNLAPGTYHFAMSAVDVNGLKSKLSSVVDVKVAAASAAAPNVPSSPAVALAAGRGVKASWVAPKTRTDGAALTASELSGYKIVLVETLRGTTIQASVSGGAATTYTVPNVAVGNYIVQLSAIDTSGKPSKNVNSYIIVN